jgi:hypothetical protein
LLAIVTTAACGDVDVYVNTNPTTTTLPRDIAPASAPSNEG